MARGIKWRDEAFAEMSGAMTGVLHDAAQGIASAARSGAPSDWYAKHVYVNEYTAGRFTTFFVTAGAPGSDVVESRLGVLARARASQGGA